MGGQNADVYYVRLVFSHCNKRDGQRTYGSYCGNQRTDREGAGGKLIAAYMTTGTNDIVVIAEVADGSDAVAAGMAAAASGAFSKLETVRAWTLPEFKGIAEKAAHIGAGFKPPGT